MAFGGLGIFACWANILFYFLLLYICVLFLFPNPIHLLRLLGFGRVSNEFKRSASILCDGNSDRDDNTRISMHMPEEIVLKIISGLPVKSLLRFRSVCKLWKSIIDDPSFVDLHLAQASSRPGSAKIIMNFSKDDNTSHLYSANLTGGPASPPLTLPGYTQADIGKACFYVLESVNGLMLLAGEENDYYICNPSTCKIMMLPSSNWHGREEFHCYKMYCQYQFGYDPINKQYKVLHIYRVGYGKRIYKMEEGCEVYTLGPEGERRGWVWLGEDFPYYLFSYNLAKGSKSVCVNGAIHWITGGRNEEQILVAFDLASNKFRFSHLPQGFPSLSGSFSDPTEFYLAEAGGRLVIMPHSKHDFMDMNLWVLEDYENQLWIEKKVKLSSFPTLSICPQHPTTPNRTIEMLLNPCSLPLDKSFTPQYLKNRADGLIRVSDLPAEWVFEYEQGYELGKNFYVDTFVESLVSLDGA